MRTIYINETGWDLHLLYRNAIRTKARRGLFGYMLRTGRVDNLIFGGAFQLIMELEPVWGKEAYHLKSETSHAREIIAVAEVALAGGFDKFALSKREMKNTIRALDEIEI